MKYSVTFTQHYEYEVDAQNECEAFTKTHEKWCAEMRSSVANTVYDDVEIICEEEEEE